MTKRILFIVNGLGMGNSTRCASIAHALVDLVYAVDVLTSGNGKKYFSSRTYISKTFQLSPLFYGKSRDGKLSVLKTALAAPKLLYTYLHNVKKLENIIRSHNYSAVVIDSDYLLFWLRKRIHIPVIAINNSDMVIEECRRMPIIPRSIRAQLLIEKLDYFFHTKVPDLVLSPSLLPMPAQNGKFERFSPFVRNRLMVRPPAREVRHVLVMLSGSQFHSRAAFLFR